MKPIFMLIIWTACSLAAGGENNENLKRGLDGLIKTQQETTMSIFMLFVASALIVAIAVAAYFMLIKKRENKK
ncbi:MAG: hypothetical protein ACP5NX_04585 [Candidatus Bilamarchaeaceae archaeon]